MTQLWTPSLLLLSQALNHNLRLVGGCVRDMLLGRSPSDIDIATPLLPGTVLSLLSSHQISAYPIAPAHGVIRATIHHHAFEITTLRQETFTPSFQEKITFIDDYETDSKRRDFTINALYLDEHNTLFDYHNGQSDLAHHRVRFIGNPEHRLLEDPLRLLRYLRFWALYGDDTPDTAILALIPKIAPLLSQVSPFRRHKEFLKLISPAVYPKVSPILENYSLFPLMCSHFLEKKLDVPSEFVAYCS